MPFRRVRRVGVCPVCNKVYESMCVITGISEEVYEGPFVRYWYIHEVKQQACSTDCDVYLPIPAAPVAGPAAGVAYVFYPEVATAPADPGVAAQAAEDEDNDDDTGVAAQAAGDAQQQLLFKVQGRLRHRRYVV